MAIRQKTKVQLTAAGTCPTHSLSKITIRDLDIEIDEPEVRGGTNRGPSPTETLLAALVGCTNVIGHKCAKALGYELGQLEINVVSDFDRRGVMLTEEVDVPFPALRLSVTASGNITEEQLQEVAAEVAKHCPLSKLFRQAGTEVQERWQLE